MKLEITDVMICEWDAVTQCIIVSPAEGWKVNVNHPISEAHASLVTMEKMEGDGYEFICKWLRCANSEQVLNFTTDRWYKCMGNFHRTGAFMGDFCRGGFAPNNHKHFDLTDARDYNPDELIGKWIKRTDASTLKESWGKLKDITGNSLHNLNPIFTFEDGEMWGKITCDVDDPRDYNPDERTPGEEARDIALRNIDESKKIKVEPNPHQLKEYDAVECTPEERAEIIRIADECGVPVYNETRTPKDLYPNLAWYNEEVAGLLSTNDIEFRGEWNLHTVPDFIAKIRGTYVENEVKEVKIPFDLERWKSGDFVRVETVEGHQIDQLVALELKDNHAMAGVVCGCFASWTEAGIFVSVMETDKDDLTLIVKQ